MLKIIDTKINHIPYWIAGKTYFGAFTSGQAKIELLGKVSFEDEMLMYMYQDVYNNYVKIGTEDNVNFVITEKTYAAFKELNAEQYKLLLNKLFEKINNEYKFYVETDNYLVNNSVKAASFNTNYCLRDYKNIIYLSLSLSNCYLFINNANIKEVNNMKEELLFESNFSKLLTPEELVASNLYTNYIVTGNCLLPVTV